MIEFIAEKFHEGGVPIMVSIALVLAGSIVIVIERAYSYWFKYDQKNSSGFMAAIQKFVMNNSIENAIRLCKKARPALLPEVLAEGLKRANDSTEEIDNAMDYAILKAAPKIQQRLGFLGTTANVATLLGLLGTLFGLMTSFDAAATQQGAEKQEALAAGIAEALTATSFGLGTALICLFFFGILQVKQTSMLDEINQFSSKLHDLLYTRKMKLKSED